MLDRQLREQIAEHERVLATRPPDRRQALVAAAKELQAAESWLAKMDAVASETARQLGELGPFAGLSRRGRQERRLVQEKLGTETERSTAARDRRDEVAGRVERLGHEQEVFEHFEAAESWRRDVIPRLQGELDQHWAQVVVNCARADDPLAFGVDKLRHARNTVATDLRRLADGLPGDRGGEWEQARIQLTDALKERHDAEQALADSRSRLQSASRRRLGHRGSAAVASAGEQLVLAEERLEQGVAAERDLRDRLAAMARHQQAHREAIAAMAPKRKELETALAQLHAALDCTRPDRVLALADELPPTWSNVSASHRDHRRAVPCGAIMRAGSRPPSTATTVRARLGRAGASICKRRRRRSPSLTGCSRPALHLSRRNGPTLPVRQPACANTCTAVLGPATWPSSC